ncbi:hypothetical protein C8J57DRAFT_308341 [Mycena rebaudengoi]|nr:hypothetical protein C8J57DRAFT_308341 [Mycena rebaudengoi]
MQGARGCFNCGGFGHQAASCPKAGTPTCYNCGLEGHVSRDCTMEAQAEVEGSLLVEEEEAEEVARNATAAARRGTSRVRVPRQGACFFLRLHGRRRRFSFERWYSGRRHLV